MLTSSTLTRAEVAERTDLEFALTADAPADTAGILASITPEERRAMQAAVTARDEFLRALIRRDYLDLARAGVDHAIQELAQEIENQVILGEERSQFSRELLEQWGSDRGRSQFEAALALGFLDIGDHAPLFPWLEDFFVKLENKYGTAVTILPIVKDLRTLNFALPIVFSPASDRWRTANQDSRIEYRKHFIPFANLITYYGSFYACRVIVLRSQYPQLKRYCKQAAEKLQLVMGRYIAPQISDFIFAVSNRRSVLQPRLSRQQLRYQTGDDLSLEIRNGGRL